MWKNYKSLKPTTPGKHKEKGFQEFWFAKPCGYRRACGANSVVPSSLLEKLILHSILFLKLGEWTKRFVHLETLTSVLACFMFAVLTSRGWQRFNSSESVWLVRVLVITCMSLCKKLHYICFASPSCKWVYVRAEMDLVIDLAWCACLAA